jgi:hypothetical protein
VNRVSSIGWPRSIARLGSTEIVAKHRLVPPVVHASESLLRPVPLPPLQSRVRCCILKTGRVDKLPMDKRRRI